MQRRSFLQLAASIFTAATASTLIPKLLKSEVKNSLTYVNTVELLDYPIHTSDNLLDHIAKQALDEYAYFDDTSLFTGGNYRQVTFINQIKGIS